MTPLVVERRQEGIYLPALELFLDPIAPVPRAYLSHAHADHAGGADSGVVFATPETLALVRARRPPDAGAIAARPLAFGDVQGDGASKLHTEPAGHVLGASQLVIDHPGGRFVYTGDVSLHEALTHPRGAPIACDQLLVESTFGVPIFSWPDPKRELERLIAFCNESIADGKRVLLLAYSLGKAQELAAALLARGSEPVLHGAAHRVALAYEELGVALGIASGRTRAYAELGPPKKKSPPAIVIAPPWSAKALAKGSVAVGFCSGFALVDAHVDRYRADAGFVLSDHASFDDLVTIARASGAKKITTTHGLADDLARHLERLGLPANALAAESIDGPEDAREQP